MADRPTLYEAWSTYHHDRLPLDAALAAFYANQDTDIILRGGRDAADAVIALLHELTGDR